MHSPPNLRSERKERKKKEKATWLAAEGKLMCGGPKRDHDEAFFSSVGPWGKKVAITWMQQVCLKHFDHVYSYKGDYVTVFNLWLHRACSMPVALCGCGCLTRNDVDGRYAMVMYRWNESTQSIVLVWESPLVPEVIWDPADFDAPVKIPSKKPLAGYFDIDFDNLPAAHKAHLARHSLIPELKMPPKVQ